MRILFLISIGLLFANPALAQESGTYPNERTMRADQTIVSRLASDGVAALEAGNWQMAVKLCGELNDHLHNSPYMGERANQVAREIAVRCNADAQAMLGNVESACRVYDDFDHKSLLSRIDTVAICRGTAHPARVTQAELMRRDFDEMREHLEAMNDLMGVINKLPVADPMRPARISELRSVCEKLPANLDFYRTVTDAFANFCMGHVHFYAGDNASSCAAARRSQDAFDSLGTQQPEVIPHRDYVDGLKGALQKIFLGRCRG